MQERFANKCVLLVGAGGIGHPAAWALVRAGVGHLVIVDDDAVEASNLHRQILFEDTDIGVRKLKALIPRVASMGSTKVTAVDGRLLPENAIALMSNVDVILDAVDNFPSRFLASDAAILSVRPIVHAAAVRWVATVLAASDAGRPCYRCVFEEMPEGDSPDCASAGVVGPVCGVAGAIAADLVLRFLEGEAVGGTLVHYDGLRDAMRCHHVKPRGDCRLCGVNAERPTLDRSQYTGERCANG